MCEDAACNHNMGTTHSYCSNAVLTGGTIATGAPTAKAPQRYCVCCIAKLYRSFLTHQGREGLPSSGRDLNTDVQSDETSGLLSGNPPGPGILKQAREIREWLRSAGTSLDHEEDELLQDDPGSASGLNPW